MTEPASREGTPGAVAELVGASRTYETPAGLVTALVPTDLQARAGELIGLCGPSGSGKTTLLHLLGLLLRPSTGETCLRGEPTALAQEGVRDSFRRRHVGFVYQEAMLVPHLSALQNVIVHRPGLAEAQALALLARFGIGDLARRRPAQLSGGEQQRVALARALAHGPSLLLADEPTGNLDDDNAAVVVTSLREHAEDDQAVVVATHDPRMIDVCSRVVRMEAGRLLESTP